MNPISVVVPVCNARNTIARTVRSVYQQSHKEWELILVVDDHYDYEKLLGEAGLLDSRICFLFTGSQRSGSPVGRNIGLDAARYDLIAILDADDCMHPLKLEIAAQHLVTHPIISCALEILRSDYTFIRTVGAGRDRILPAGEYKFTNYSSDSMLVYNRRVSDPRFDPKLSCVTDVDFTLKLLAKCAYIFHLGTPLHSYFKMPGSVTNDPKSGNIIAETKRLILQRLLTNHYPLANELARKRIVEFLELSIKAEDIFVSKNGHFDVLYETIIEKLIIESNNEKQLHTTS